VKLAFIAPFYGPDASGGAEAECRQTAHHLAEAGHQVEVWTTCARDLVHGWTFNWHSAGCESDGNVTVHRFRALTHGMEEFSSLHTRLLNGDSLSLDEEQQFFSLFCNAPDLYRHIGQHAENMDWLLFIPYLFGTAVNGTRIAPQKSILIPCLHDEAYARSSSVADMFHRCARTVFHTQAELDLAATLYPSFNAEQARCIGEGVDQDFESDPARFRERFDIHTPFLLYAGRKDASKNVDWLVQAFLKFKEQDQHGIQLICIGPGELSVPGSDHPAIQDLGFVSRQEKYDAYDAAWMLCQPSLNESFSLVMMEAWSRGTPCLVHGHCAVTREHAIRSGGGLYPSTSAEFTACLNRLQSDSELTRRLGDAGKRYVRKNFHWDHIVTQFETKVLA
jgi:glycosyltransferase involved in cell wall biosynthesis